MRISDWSSDVCSSDLLLGVVSEGLLQLLASFRKLNLQRTVCPVPHKIRGGPGGIIREAHSVDDHPLRLHVGAESLRLRERAAVRSVLIDLLAGAAASATASRVLGDHTVMVDGVEIAVGHDDHHLHHLLAEVDLVVLHRLTLEGPEIAEVRRNQVPAPRSEEHTSELQSLMRISYDVFCLEKTNNNTSLT